MTAMGLGRRAAGWLPFVMLMMVLALTGPVRAQNFQGMLNRFIKAESLAGGVLLVSGPMGRSVVAAGMADTEKGVAMTPQSRFYVASVGKMATAVATLQLVQEGRLSLSSPIAGLLGTMPTDRIANIKSATLEQVLTHTSGIPDYLNERFSEASSERPDHIWTAAESMAFARGEKPPGRPGKVYDYSNSNYVLLGQVVETADGTSFAESLKQRIFTPAGMTATTVGAGNFRDPTLAHGYTEEDGDVSAYSWTSITGDGPLVTTAEDLERFAFALFRDGRLLAPAMLKTMQTTTDLESAYAMGLEIWDDRWGTAYGHTGSYDGFESEVRYYPERQTVMVFLTNGNQLTDTDLLDKAASAVFGGQ